MSIKTLIPQRFIPPCWLCVALILLATFFLKLRNLDHTALTRWDEVFHAIVAQNVMKHPLKPTLIDVPYLPYDSTKWGENHVWLHKPILPFWQIALSFAALGVNTFALRLPSAILSTAAAWLTYLIGKELFDRPTGLIAATLQAANPFLLTLVHGYQFADHIDVAVLFWVEAGVYFLVRGLRTGSLNDFLVAGAAQGLAYLCKSYLAAIILGIALTALLLPICRLAKREDCRIGLAGLLGLLGATAATIVPWLAYCLINYSQEFWYEDAQIWRHFGSNVENWAAPWDRVVFDYLIAQYGVFYTTVLMAAIVLIGRACVQRHTGLWLVYAWGVGVLLPHLLAETKTPSATLIGMPPLWLLLGHLVAEAWRGKYWPLVALTAVLAMSLVFPAVIKNPGNGYPSPREFGVVMSQSWWVIDQLCGALTVVVLAAIPWMLLREGSTFDSGRLGRCLQAIAIVFCTGTLVWLAFESVDAAWLVTDKAESDRASVEVGQFVRDQLPNNAVLLCEERKGYEHLTIMFYADRTCYALQSRGPDGMARRIVDAGGVPYVVAYQPLRLISVFTCSQPGPTVFLWQAR